MRPSDLASTSSEPRVGRIVALLVGLGVGAGLFLFGPRPAPLPKTPVAPVAREVQSRLRELAAAVKARATTLAELPRLSSAVATDANTVRDLTQDELAFRPKKGETITIGQVPKKGSPMVLLTLPEGAKPSPTLEKFGERFVVEGVEVHVIDNESVTPKERADELTGALAVMWMVDLAPLAENIDAAGVSAKLVLDGKTLVLGKRAMVAGDREETVKLELQNAGMAELVVAGPVEPAAPGPLQYGGLGIAALGLLAGALWPKKREPALALPPSLATDFAPVRTNVGNVGSSNASTLGSLGVKADGTTTAGQSHIGRYDIVRKLGSGGMAEVYLAKAQGEAGFEKLFALKVLHKSMTTEAMVVEHFLDEARLASRLSHPNIVQISDLGRADDEYFIAMEFIDGSDLERLMALCDARGEHVPLKIALFVLRKICDGLHAAHTALAADGQELGLVHRDVKSANVFVSRQGAVKVGDFGIAKVHIAGAVRKTEVGMVKGTVAYMAPEQRVGKAIDRRADLYAVGAIAYELLTGQQINLDLALLAERGRQGWPHLTPPSQVRADLPVELDAILWKALAYEAADRYPDCSQLEEAFEAVASKAGQIASEKAVASWVEELLRTAPKTAERAAVQPG